MSDKTGTQSGANNTTAQPADEADAATPSTKHSLRFWGIVASLSFTALCSAIEGTIITSALPTITADLGGGSSFIWVPNAYFLATMVMLPLMAQAANVFGRRWLTLLSVAEFTLGSGICGGATSPAMLIGGRVV
jgi:MFS family permease